MTKRADSFGDLLRIAPDKALTEESLAFLSNLDEQINELTGISRATHLGNIAALAGATARLGLPDHHGVSQAGGHQLLDLPQPPSAGQDAQGAAAQRQDHPHHQAGDARVADEQQRAADRRSTELLLKRIDQVTVQMADRGETRAYIGASSIGDPCQAYQALSLRGFTSSAPDAQLQRIFDEGHRIEGYVVEFLRAAGVKFREVDPATGKQWHFNTMGGHIAANLDGMVWKQRPFDQPPTHTLEIKSMNRQLFEAFVKKGVAVSHPHYYDQMQLGLGLAEMNCSMFVAYCKDNSRFHIEFVYFDAARFEELVTRAVGAMFAEKAERLESWDCTRCFKAGSCKSGVPPGGAERHCRHCRHAMPDVSQPGKKWLCKLHGHADVSTPCSDFAAYQLITIAKAKK